MPCRNWNKSLRDHFGRGKLDFWSRRHCQSPSKWRLRAHVEAIWTFFQPCRVYFDTIPIAYWLIKWQFIYRIKKIRLHNSWPSPGETNRGIECENTRKDMEPTTFQLTKLVCTALQLSSTVTLDNYMMTFPTTFNCSTKTGLCKETQMGSLNLPQSSTLCKRRVHQNAWYQDMTKTSQHSLTFTKTITCSHSSDWYTQMLCGQPHATNATRRQERTTLHFANTHFQ